MSEATAGQAPAGDFAGTSSVIGFGTRTGNQEADENEEGNHERSFPRRRGGNWLYTRVIVRASAAPKMNVVKLTIEFCRKCNNTEASRARYSSSSLLPAFWWYFSQKASETSFDVAFGCSCK